LKVATKTGAIAMKLADRFLGLSFLEDLSEFFLAFESMYDGFKERAQKVHALLRDGRSAFLLVASPSDAALGEALYFHERLREKRMPLVGFIVNRTHPEPSAGPTRRDAPKPDLPASFRDRLLQVHEDYRTLRRAEAKAIGRLEVDTGQAPILVPELESDVHDLRGLHEVGRALLPS
jgi:anion-transporting  ArsA/GET3 family ATPase